MREMRRKRSKTRRRILWGITYAEAAAMLLAITAIDSPSPTIPIIVLLQAMAWLGLFFWANPVWKERVKK